MTVKTVQFDSKRGGFEVRNYELPELRAGEILVEVRLCTICGSDLHTFSGRRDAPADCVLGHEIIGNVVAWGGAEPPVDYHGTPLQIGQRVTWSMAVGCGECFFCKNELAQKCVSLFKYGHEPGTSGRPTGGLSSHCVLVPRTPVFPIPDTLSDKIACPANCATSTVTAALRLVQQTHAIAGATVMITGAGMLGLTAAAQLSDAGAGSVLVVEPSEQRRQLARQFGATHTIGTDDAAAVIEVGRQLTDGRGADIAIDFAGVKPAVQSCIDSVRTGGCVMLAGSVFPGSGIEIPPEQLVRRMLTIRGIHNYLPRDLAESLQFLERTQDRFPYEELIGESFELNDATNAFQQAATSSAARVAVVTSR